MERPLHDKKRFSRIRVTLLGDAAHPMTPFKAQGANQALSDAVLLARLLKQNLRDHGRTSHVGWGKALEEFERKMLKRSHGVVVGSREKAAELHGGGTILSGGLCGGAAAGRGVIELLRARGIGAHSAEDPRGLDALVAEVVEEVSDDAKNRVRWPA